MSGLFHEPENMCAEFLDRIENFLAGTLPEDVQIEFEKHRIECPRCRKAIVEEERVRWLMSRVPAIEAPADFRDRVLRAWRLRRDMVTQTFPVATVKRLQILLGAILVVLLLLPMARESLFAAAKNLEGAVDRLPAEYGKGLEISFTLPTLSEVGIYFRLWQAKLFEFMGNLGSSLADWTGWLWAALVLLLVLAVVNFRWLRSRLPSAPEGEWRK